MCTSEPGEHLEGEESGDSEGGEEGTIDDFLQDGFEEVDATMES